ncbi:MAG: hypothetical protein KME35_17905 [Aphanocapsa sp. GSE-SYN-MK-11-07L]|jgi:hypothetical protein|nr:hypothetical protein [Aphanocapsa sp. GSE-SYN-MK-11-07L]
MTEQIARSFSDSGSYSADPAQQRDSLRSECHKLIEVIARRPGCLKLLMGAVYALEVFADYKRDRSIRKPPGP